MAAAAARDVMAAMPADATVFSFLFLNLARVLFHCLHLLQIYDLQSTETPNVVGQLNLQVQILETNAS
jgi:hypothetical protein